MLQDVRLAFRTLGRARGFAAAAVLTLGVAMGGSTIVYAIADALLLRPLPFGARSGRLITLHSTHPSQAQDWDDSLLSAPDLLDIADSSRSLATLEGIIGRNVSLSSSADAERVSGASVTPALFHMLGATPQLGRLFADGDGAAIGQESVVILSDGIWRRLYGGDPTILGRAVPVNGRQLTVVGVMPPRFGFPDTQEVWLPLRLTRAGNRAGRAVLAFGLLRENVSLDEARAELDAIAARLAERYPATNRQWGVFAMPMRDLFVRPPLRRGLTAMLAAVVLVLLVACANVAGLLVARGVGRQREIALRAAFGARRGRLVRMLLAESLLLATAGAALGLLMASWGLDALMASNPEPPPFWARFEIGWRVMTFAGLLVVLATLASGLVPAVKVTQSDGAEGWLQGARTAGATSSQRKVQSALVVGQVAVSLALLLGAALLLRTSLHLRSADAGFRPEPLLSLRLYIAGDAYDDPVARSKALSRVVQRLQAMPGAAAAAVTGAIPADDGGDGVRLLPDRGNADEAIGAQVVPITPALFETLGLALVEGRTLTLAESENPASDVAIVNRRLAARLGAGQSVVGKVLRVDGAEPAVFRVIGVVPDVVYEELGEESAQSRLTVYLPFARLGWRSMALLVRAHGDPAALTSGARRAVRGVDPSFATYDAMTMEQRRAFTHWGERFIARAFAVFALVAWLLACIGSYGLTAYSATQRTREIGLRMAVGATRRDIVAMLVGRGARLAAVGLLIGVPLSIAAARGLQGLLFGVSPWNAQLWAIVLTAVLLPVLVASLVPARRASLRDPALALREE